MFPTIQLGPLNIQVPGLIIIISMWAGLSLSEKSARRNGYPADKLYNLVLISLLAGVIGARLSFALNNIYAFSKSFSSIFSLNPGLLDPFGGTVTALLAAFIYGHKNHLGIWSTLDTLTPFFAVVMIGIGVSHLSSGNAYGEETSLPWGFHLWGEVRHPSQVYEIAASCVTLLIIWRDFSKTASPGMHFLKLIIITSIWKIFLEGFRGDSQITAAGIRSNQVIALIILAVSAILYEKRISNKDNNLDYESRKNNG
jgi:phosphatidylglycerol---prolipoprotein diacylglyceryl transferase